MMFRGTVHLLLYRLVYHELLIPAEEVHDAGEPGGLPRLQLPALPPRLGPVPHGLRHAPPVRLPAPRDAPPLPAGDGLHRLLAADQHLLEGLHGPDRVQPGGVPAEALAAAGGAGGGDGWPCSWRPGCCTPTSRSGCGAPGASACPTPCSGASSASWCWSTSSSTPAGRGPGRARAATPSPRSRSRSAAAQDRRHLHHDRPALVALVEPEPRRLAGDAASRGPDRGFGDRHPGPDRRDDLYAAEGHWLRTRLAHHVPTRAADRATAGDAGAPGLGPGAGRGRVGAPSRLRESLRSDLLNRADYERMERGYYEQLLDAGRRLGAWTAGLGRASRRCPDAAGPTWRPRRSRRGRWPASSTTSASSSSSRTCRSSTRGRAGAPTRWGCATASTPTAKPPRTFRIALVGDSIGAGWGVERRTGVRADPRAAARRAVAGGGRAGGRGPQLRRARPRARPALGPLRAGRLGDAARPGDLRIDPGRRRLGRAPAPRPAARGRRLGLRRSTATSWPRRARGRAGDLATYKRALRPYRWEFLAGVYRAVAADCRARGVPCVWVAGAPRGQGGRPGRAPTAGRAGAGARGSRRRRPLRRLRRDRPGRAGDRPERLPSQRRRPRPAGPPARRGPGAAAGPRGSVPSPGRRHRPWEPTDHDPNSNRPSHRPCPCSASRRRSLVLAVGLVPWPRDWARARSALDSARSPELNRADREASAGGYYEGLIGGVDGTEGTALRADAPAAGQADRLGPLPRRQRLALPARRLPPCSSSSRTSTGPSSASRSRPTPTACATGDYAVEKPAGTFRIAVLGSSMDMGWGVGTDETYVNRLEDWLNAHAARLGLAPPVRGAQLRRRRL